MASRQKSLRSRTLIIAASLAAILPAPHANAQFTVGGRIGDEYVAAAHANGQSPEQYFGPATSQELPAARNGRWQHFNSNNRNNSIYWHDLVSGSRANQIGGAIRDKWGTIAGPEGGYEWGPARYPTTRETSTRTSPSGTSGRFNHFEDGHSIYWSQRYNSAVHVHGDIRDQWEARDWEAGSMGWPLFDEMYCFGRPGTDGKEQPYGGRGQYFEGGWLLWNAANFRMPSSSRAAQWAAGDLPQMSFRTASLDSESHKADFRRMFGVWNQARPFNFWEESGAAMLHLYDETSSGDLNNIDRYGVYNPGSWYHSGPFITMYPDKIAQDNGTYASTALHEIGHALGIRHTCQRNIMGPSGQEPDGSNPLQRESLGRLDTYEVQDIWKDRKS